MASSEAKCLTTGEFDWMSNGKGDSPCLVAAQLAEVCTTRGFTLEALQPGYIYLGPTRAQVNACRCSSVYYSLLSACAECQGNTHLRWTAYNGNCTDVYLENYPNPIPIGVSVPHWAYLDVSIDDNFNATRAEAAVGPESTAPPRASSTQTGGGGTSRGTSPTEAASNSEGSSTNVGAIAGGVVGGVVGLALIGLLVFFLMRRRSKKGTAPSDMYSNAAPSMHGPAPSAYSDGFAASPEPKPYYNPNDPATFPLDMNSFSTPPPQHTGTPITPSFTGQTGVSHGQPMQVSNTGHTGYAMPPPSFGQPNRPGTPSGGRYTGVPEL